MPNCNRGMTLHALASEAMMTTNGPAIKSHGHGSRYHRRVTRSTGNDEAGLFMTYHLVVVDGLNDELDLVRARTKFIPLIVFVMLALAARVQLGDQTHHVVLRPAKEFGIRFWARIAPCGPPKAALLVLADGRS